MDEVTIEIRIIRKLVLQLMRANQESLLAQGELEGQLLRAVDALVRAERLAKQSKAAVVEPKTEGVDAA